MICKHFLGGILFRYLFLYKTVYASSKAPLTSNVSRPKPFERAVVLRRRLKVFIKLQTTISLDRPEFLRDVRAEEHRMISWVKVLSQASEKVLRYLIMGKFDLVAKGDSLWLQDLKASGFDF